MTEVHPLSDVLTLAPKIIAGQIRGRVVIDIADARISKSKALPSGQGPVRRVRSGPRPGNDLRIVNFAEGEAGATFELAWKGRPWAKIAWQQPGIGGQATALFFAH